MPSPAPAAATAKFDEVRWTSFDGLSLYGRTFGAKGARLPVICLPGLTRNSRDWEAVAAWMAAQGRRVYALDLRGRGFSAHATSPKTYKPAVYARDVKALMDGEGIASAVLFGTSLGGLITMTLAAKHSKKVAAAILNDIGPHVAKVGLTRIASYAGKGSQVKTWDDAAAYCQRTNGVVFPNYAAKDWAAMARRVFRENKVGVPVLDYDPKIFRPVPAWLVRITEPLLWRSFRRLARRRPTLLLRGALSDLLDAKTLTRMRKIAPRMTVVEVAGVGHAPDLSEPDARAAIGEFLARVP